MKTQLLFVFRAWRILMFPHHHYGSNLDFMRYGEDYDEDWQHFDKATFFHLLNNKITPAVLNYYTF